MAECIIKGVNVKFPFEPYELQKEYMSKVIECLQDDKHGVLESPTGTGKTLSLLCSSLAWLEIKKASMQAEFQKNNRPDLITGNQDPSIIDIFGNLNNAAGSSNAENANRTAFLQWPQIIYASRTHSQLSQAMNELKRTSYKYMRASVLGSREQMCIHPEVKELESNTAKVQMCRIKVKGHACLYHRNVEREKMNAVFSENTVIDIEDLVKFGDSQKFCPYYMAKELRQRADIVFMPYNYLIDPRLRKSLNIELSNSVVILDEAHNVERICEDSASMQLKSTDITLCIDEITAIMKMISDETSPMRFGGETEPDFSPEELAMLKGIVLEFEKALDGVVIPKIGDGATFEGKYIFALFETAGVTDKNHNFVTDLIERVSTFLVTINDGPFQRKGHGLKLFEDLVRIVFASISEDFKVKLNKCYKVHVHIEDSEKFGAVANNWLSKATSKKSECRVLSFWCFSPGFGMNMLMGQGIKSIILTSGTLAPLKPLITELELDVGVRLENPHIVKGDQICVKILSSGPDGTQLNSSFKTRNDPTYIKSLGMTICNLTRMIPGGLLIFFPSYPIMKMCQEKWQEAGIWSNICQYKPIYVEPRQKQAFQECMTNYYESIAGPPAGAIFMGVCRGKVSEGLDFVDANGRAVIITGLPYPPLKDPRVILKKRYLDTCRRENSEYLTGDAWYSLEATKAVNQAIGRVIRHGGDYGAIILLDSRFNNPRIIQQMSSWLRPHVKNVNNYGAIVRELRGFFQTAAQKFPAGVRIKEPPQKLVIPGFSSTRGKKNGNVAENEVAIAKRSGDKAESQFKRTKFALKSRDASAPTTSGTSETTIEKPNGDDIREYLQMIAKNLPLDHFNAFLKMIRVYTQDEKLENVFEVLSAIFDDQPTLCYLLTGWRNFIKVDHRDEYDTFIAKFSL